MQNTLVINSNRHIINEMGFDQFVNNELSTYVIMAQNVEILRQSENLPQS